MCMTISNVFSRFYREVDIRTFLTLLCHHVIAGMKRHDLKAYLTLVLKCVAMLFEGDFMQQCEIFGHQQNSLNLHSQTTLQVKIKE